MPPLIKARHAASDVSKSGSPAQRYATKAARCWLCARAKTVARRDMNGKIGHKPGRKDTKIFRSPQHPRPFPDCAVAKSKEERRASGPTTTRNPPSPGDDP